MAIIFILMPKQKSLQVWIDGNPNTRQDFPKNAQIVHELDIGIHLEAKNYKFADPHHICM